MNSDDIAFVIGLCRLRAGLRVLPERAYLIESRLTAVAREEGLDSVASLIAAARDPAQKRLRWRIVEAMTSGETSFFRDRAVFDHLRAAVLPALAAARGAAPIRIWSAACATGQEIYSLAILARELEETQGFAADLYASDIDSHALAHARAGLYSQSDVQRGLPIRTLIRRFQKAGDGWRAGPELRSRIRWRRLNLIAPFQDVGRFDLILCRNALNDMEAPSRATALRSMAAVLAPDGYLVLGAHENAEASRGAFLAEDGAPGLYRPVPRHEAAAA